jgi:hypothetical protein
MKSRPLGVADLPMLQRALDQDEYKHVETKNYTMDNSHSVVYEDDKGPIGVLRYTKTLRLLTVWCNNGDKKRNAASTILAIIDSVKMARDSGFTDIIFETESPTLKQFCKDRLGFQEAGNTMVLHV